MKETRLGSAGTAALIVVLPTGTAALVAVPPAMPLLCSR